MKLDLQDIKEEKEYLSLTKDIIKSLIHEKQKSINIKSESIISGKRHLWQNLIEYNGAEMYSTMNEADLHVSIINSEIIKMAKLERSLESPYFGRVDFNNEKVYIGVTSVFKDREYVYDWRSPIGNLYYNYGIGKACYDSPNGLVSGDITLKRQFKIERGNLIEAFNTDIILEDELLQEVLLSSSSDSMKNIVSTIQKEQNDLIRYKNKKDLIIDGVAGSGKTSVALHRIAYLLYNDKNLTNKNVLIFSPSDIFTSYIANVLPELGEENVLSVTKEKFAEKYIKGVTIEGLNHFYESIYENNLELDYNISHKFSSEYIDELDRFIKDYVANLKFKSKIGFKNKFFLSSELNSMFDNLSKLSLSDRIENMALKICDVYSLKKEEQIKIFIKTLKNMLGIDTNPLKLYKKFLNDENFDATNISYEDVAPILYLYFEINGYPNYSHIKQIVIDEAQDYSILDFKLIKKIFNSATFTILGDKNQVVNPYLKYDSFESIQNCFTGSDIKFMNKAYRSSYEIIEYSNKILNIKNIEPVRNKGRIKVREEKYNITTLKDTLEDIKNKYKRIAIITKSMKTSEELLEELKGKDIGLITDSILKKVIISPSYLSKGLEFDAVIVYPDNYNGNKNLYYVVLTRAQHELIIFKR